MPPDVNTLQKIFCDYEYFLQCIDIWGQDSIQIVPTVLVNYIQTSDGIIGRSKYSEWTEELDYILENSDKYKILNDRFSESLRKLSTKYKKLSIANKKIKAFVGQ